MSKTTNLAVIVFAQFACTSLWFAGNGVIAGLSDAFGLAPSALGHLTSAVQLGFIAGTLGFAYLGVADRFAAPRVFFLAALVGATINAMILLPVNTFFSLFAIRFLTGASLAGIYPVGMKIAADHFPEGLGKALGFLVGALVLGTAFPHFARFATADYPWESVILITSFLAFIGGALMLVRFMREPRHQNRRAFRPSALVKAFRHKEFRQAAFGYFGHMWELYALWAFIPVFIAGYCATSGCDLDVSLITFFFIAIGGLSCAAGGYLSGVYGSRTVAFGALAASGVFCLISPVLFALPVTLFVLCILIWGMLVIADSPQFSTLVARSAPPDLVGSSLTIVNGIGFAISVFSIQLLNSLQSMLDVRYLLLLLALGPLPGLIQAGIFRRRHARLNRQT